jgi:hypothetical protein
MVESATKDHGSIGQFHFYQEMEGQASKPAYPCTPYGVCFYFIK